MNNRVKKQEKAFKYHRTCELEECTIEFDTNRKNHYFCDPVHQQEYWKRIRTGEASLRNTLRKLEKKINELNELRKLKDEIKQIKAHLGIE